MADDPAITGWRIRIRGLVQGVGFRPYVWRIANNMALHGSVANDGQGVLIDLAATKEDRDAFLARLKEEAPPLSRIDGMEIEAAPANQKTDGFSIIASTGGDVATGVVPDAATCADCLREIIDPADRRFGYAFTNCTNCGPRLSIVHAIPYDRASTSMKDFIMCADCQREYDDPADRRFHAQPNACPKCGPSLWLEDKAGRVETSDPVAEAASHIAAGAIVALKGIGGFHLACDATNADAVAMLRKHKNRYAKPLAVMMPDLAMVRRYCALLEGEAALLSGVDAPITVLAAKGEMLADGISPGQDTIGVMLPYSPLHHLLLKACGGPLVMTSGNRSDEPQAIGNDEARARLTGIADYWLMHDRDIVNRLDDSVIRLDAPGPQVIRHARGRAPRPLILHEAFRDAPPVLAMGGELKSTFCLLSEGQAVLSQHMGDLEEVATHADYRKNLDLYLGMYDFTPAAIAVDHHEAYLSTQWGKARAKEVDLPLIGVQHHHAHLASCLAENGIGPDDGNTLGIILDGLGLGDDGTIWGGEMLLGGYHHFERVAHFKPVPLPGGAQAMREPWRNLIAHLVTAFGPGWCDVEGAASVLQKLDDLPVGTIEQMIEKRLNAPLSSSVGRLFDAVAASLGLSANRQHFEGQAAMELEAIARPHIGSSGAYEVAVDDTSAASQFDWSPMWCALLADVATKTEPGIIAARFHNGLASALVNQAAYIANSRGVKRIALSGGVIQNKILHEALFAGLSAKGFEILTQQRVPANDGGLALGQAVIAAIRQRG